MVHLLTVYDEHLLQRLSQAGFALGAIPRTVFVDEDFWAEALRECPAQNSVEDVLRRALQKRSEQAA